MAIWPLPIHSSSMTSIVANGFYSNFGGGKHPARQKKHPAVSTHRDSSPEIRNSAWADHWMWTEMPNFSPQNVLGKVSRDEGRRCRCLKPVGTYDITAVSFFHFPYSYVGRRVRVVFTTKTVLTSAQCLLMSVDRVVHGGRTKLLQVQYQVWFLTRFPSYKCTIGAKISHKHMYHDGRKQSYDTINCRGVFLFLFFDRRFSSKAIRNCLWVDWDTGTPDIWCTERKKKTAEVVVPQGARVVQHLMAKLEKSREKSHFSVVKYYDTLTYVCETGKIKEQFVTIIPSLSSYLLHGQRDQIRYRSTR